MAKVPKKILVLKQTIYCMSLAVMLRYQDIMISSLFDLYLTF